MHRQAAIDLYMKLDQVFLTLYRELFYRHIYAHLTPTLEQRFHSYENYCDLFNYILSKYTAFACGLRETLTGCN